MQSGHSNKKLIVSFDGGGVRGKFYVYFIEQLEIHMGVHLSDLIDMAAGVSVGAAMAAYVVTGRKVTSHVSELVNTAFGGRSILGPWLQPTYTGIQKKEALVQLFKNRTFADLPKEKELLILCADTTGAPVYFSKQSRPNCELVSAIDASTAAPIYFPPVELQGELLIDGGIVTNIPVMEAVEHARSIWGGDTELYILSLGCGLNTMRSSSSCSSNNTDDYGVIKWLKDGLIDVMYQNFHDRINMKLLPKGHLLRINCGVVCPLDDVCDTTDKALKQDAEKVWLNNASIIMDWLKPFISRRLTS